MSRLNNNATDRVSEATILRVAIFPPGPLNQCLDYLPPAGSPAMTPGVRVKVRFGKQRGLGLVMECVDHSEIAGSRLRPVDEVLDTRPVVSSDMLKLLHWVGKYYHYPAGKVLEQTLPAFFRCGKVPEYRVPKIWFARKDTDITLSSRAVKQKALYELLLSHSPASEQFLDDAFKQWRPLAQALLDKRLIYSLEADKGVAAVQTPPQLNTDQSALVARLHADMEAFSCHLLEGITGSGKTEIYMQAVVRVLAAGRQALILVPEIGLIPQTLRCFEERFGAVVASFHSGMSEGQRAHSWCRAHSGDIKIVIGTRSSIFMPFLNLGLIVVDEEHDQSYKQNDRLRYHARNLAVKRAQLLDIPIILGSATPSLESLHNALIGSYRHHQLTQRIGQVSLPKYEVINLCQQPVRGGLSSSLITMMRERLARDEQILLFLNRRGYAPKLLCHSCGQVMECARCDVPMTYHAYNDTLRCHHCDKSLLKPACCPQCGKDDLQTTGIGTEQIESELQSLFPDTGIVRIDADSTQRKGELEKHLEAVRQGGAKILIGTQMISKGHHFPNITLTGIVNVDQRLFSSDFRGIEQLGQLIVQVAGRAGRGDKAGVVALQTHHPEHPALQELLRYGYHHFAKSLLATRSELLMPPYQYLGLLNAESQTQGQSIQFLALAADEIRRYADKQLEILGPTPMVMEKRRGFYRAHLLLNSPDRLMLNRILAAALPAIRGNKMASKVRWYLDIDPLEIE